MKNLLLIPFLASTVALGDRIQETRMTSVNWPDVTEVQPKVEPESVQAPPPTVIPETLKKFRVLIDVGHGGHDLGAPGHNGVLEKDICLAIAMQAKARLERIAKLQDFPIDVRLSRETDYFLTLRDRVKDANQWGADLFISVHANSSPVLRARGFEVYFLSNEASDADASRVAKQENKESTIQALSRGVLSILSDLKNNHHIIESSRFAESIYSSLAEKLRPNGKGVRQAPFAVLSGTQMPALLVEVGYLTNPQEAATLITPPYQRRIAAGLAEGVLDFALRMRRISKSPPLRSGTKRTT